MRCNEYILLNSNDYIYQQTMEELIRSIKKASPPSASSSQDNNRSTLKRLFSSVCSLIDSDQEVSHFELGERPSRIQALLQNSVFVSHLRSKIRSEGLCQGYSLPIIRFAVYSGFNYPHAAMAQSQKTQLDRNDLVGAFSRFGQLNKVSLSSDRSQAFIFFNSFLNAYICLKMLRGCGIGRGNMKLVAEWMGTTDLTQQITSEVGTFINGLNWQSLLQVKNQLDYSQQNQIPVLSGANRQNKFTCRYDIQIENEREFQVARRIIGSKGYHMKRILEECLASNSQNKNNINDSVNQLLKLRLRGRGSGYKEGPQQQQSNQSLHLCVSAKDQAVYNSACARVEQLLFNIYIEYAEYTSKNGTPLHLTVRKVLVGTSPGDETVSLGVSSCCEDAQRNQQIQGGQSYRISPQKIAELLELRNKARRQLNFSEADRIRNYLRGCGVCLIDEKGRRGKANQVTTWKYLY